MPQAIWQYERSLVENDAQTGLRILSFMFLLYNFYLYKIIYIISSRISGRVKSPHMTSKRPRYGVEPAAAYSPQRAEERKRL